MAWVMPGYAVAAEVSEVAKGLSLDRPGIRELLGLAGQGCIGEILVANLSRISRNTAGLLRFEEMLGKQNVRLNALQGNPLAGFRGIEEVFCRATFYGSQKNTIATNYFL